MRTGKGFTLIELLVVISIIGLLSSVVLASLAQARIAARDSKRISELKSVTSAIALYRLDNNGNLPPYGAVPSGCTTVQCLSSLTSALVPKYISSIPVDPTAGVTDNGYRYCYTSANGGRYNLLVHLEKNSGWCRFLTPDPDLVGCWSNNASIPVCD